MPNDHGSGGLEVVVRKGRGVPKLAKAKGSDEILWVKMEEMGKIIFVGVVYLVPSKSTRYHLNGSVRRELTMDILRFSSEGLVIVMGDLNSRIADYLPAYGGMGHKVRVSKDMGRTIMGKNGYC